MRKIVSWSYIRHGAKWHDRDQVGVMCARAFSHTWYLHQGRGSRRCMKLWRWNSCLIETLRQHLKRDRHCLRVYGEFWLLIHCLIFSLCVLIFLHFYESARNRHRQSTEMDVQTDIVLSYIRFWCASSVECGLTQPVEFRWYPCPQEITRWK